MKTPTKLFLIIVILLIATLILGCKSVIKNNAPICRIKFDLTDTALLQLNLQNKKAVKSFTEVCER